MGFDEFQKRIVIAMTTYNRKAVTEICLKNIHDHKGLATLWVFDDHSGEFTVEDLQKIAPEATITKHEKKLGIDKLRIHIHETAKLSPFKFIYHIDNDAYHDPKWLERLFELHCQTSMPLGLYNSPLHRWHTLSKHSGYDLRKECPGVSFFYEVSKLPNELPQAFGSWDSRFSKALQPFAVSDTSYIEHFGAHGIHNKDFERDRAKNPTEWLKSERPRILAILTGTSSS